MWDPPCTPHSTRVGWVVVMQSLALVFGMCGVHDVHGGIGNLGCMMYMELMRYMG